MLGAHHTEQSDRKASTVDRHVAQQVRLRRLALGYLSTSWPI